jgi:type IX secretion system PorP/SprF family membrane protein
MKKLIILLGIISAGLNTKAQQEAMFTHYSFNTLQVNPAYASSRDALTVLALQRSQWIAFPGAPVTQTATAHMPVFNEKIGLGISLLHDKIGPSKNTGIFIDLAYKIKVAEKGKLAFGLKGGTSFLSNSVGDLDKNDPGDGVLIQNIQSRLLPNFGFGLYYSMPRFYVGLSSPKLLTNKLGTNTSGNGIAYESRHYFVIAGAMFDLNKSAKLQLKPTTFLKITSGAPLELDLTALLYYDNKFWAGPMFRSGDAFGILIGMNITQQYSLGYCFDWSYGNSTGKYNAGSHELMLRYDFVFKNKTQILSPRYF